jgi:F0F1-type ATP synthase membrane subunit b/b'
MNERGIEEIISQLYEMVQDARNVPLSADKCMIERDRVLDLLDEISNQLPGELKQARTIVESRGEVINNTKREAENILKQAQAQARQMVSDNEIYRQAQIEANGMIEKAQAKIKDLKGVTFEYVDDALSRTEASISEALSQNDASIRETLDRVRTARAQFNNLVAAQSKTAPAVIEEED